MSGNHFYCYSFEPSDAWTEFFARQPELQAYFESVMDKHGIGPHVRWETEVLGRGVGRRRRHLVGHGSGPMTAPSRRSWPGP